MSVIEKDFTKYIQTDENEDNINVSSITLRDGSYQTILTMDSVNNVINFTRNINFQPCIEGSITAPSCLTQNNAETIINSNRCPVLNLKNAGISNTFASFTIPSNVVSGSILNGYVNYRCSNPIPGTTFDIGIYIFVYKLDGTLDATYSTSSFPLPAENTNFIKQFLVTLNPLVTGCELVNFEFIRQSSGIYDTNSGSIYVSHFGYQIPIDSFF